MMQPGVSTARPVLIALLFVCASPALQAEQPGSGTSKAEPADPGAPAEAIEQWRSRRFGMFIHWGPVALTGHEIGWSRGRKTPIAEYDQLYKRFNPERFNADEWVETAKAAGMKYLVITAKHHDGFCIWPSAFTDYDIGESPFKRDPLKELSEACKRQGIAFGTYYSTCDWWHPEFPKGSPGGRTIKANADLDKYDQYLQNQVKELVTNYGPLSTIWFDVPQVYTAKHGIPMVKRLRELQPNIVINNRAFAAKGRTSGFSQQTTVGDYTTPEQRIGGFDRDRPWETCMTICRQWSWKPDDDMKSLKQCVQTLLYTVGGDGNLLFNVGPMPDGRIESRQVKRLAEMGAWVKGHGDAVYGTRGGPFKPGKWGASTCKDDKVYLFVMNWPTDGTLVLPAVNAKINNARLLSGGAIKVQQHEDIISVDVPADRRDDIATVVELTVDGTAFEIEPVAVVHRSDSLAFGGNATASNTYQKSERHQPDMAFDDNPETRWATDADTTAAWIEVDLGRAMEIGRIHIDEPAQYRRIQAFQVQYRDGTAWKTIHTGTTIGPEWSRTVTPVTARYVRLEITQASDSPTINEFQLFAPQE